MWPRRQKLRDESNGRMLRLQKVGEELGKIFSSLCASSGLGSDVLGELHDEREVIEGRLVDRADAIVDKVGGEEQRKRKDLCIVVCIRIERTDPFRVDDQQVDLQAFQPLSRTWHPAQTHHDLHP